MYARMFPEESDNIERYISGLPDMIHESVMASKPKTMQEVIEFTTELMDKKINTFTKRQAKNKRKFKDTSKNNQNQQQNKRQNTSRAYTVRSVNKKPYGGQKPTCFDCRSQGLFKRECPKLKNNNRDNPAGNGNALAKVSQIDITPTALDHYYDVELVNGRIIGLNTILRGCTLNFLNYPFNIDLMPIELGSFDAIIVMVWLAKYQAVIVCTEKIVLIP
nr:hypothetical protein [Tanacetum cinerariifolium]